MISDINIYLVIDRLLPEDNYAIINNQLNNPSSPQDLGGFFDLLSGEINHSIINLTVQSKFTLTINSKIESEFYQDINSSAFLEVNGTVLENGGTSNVLTQMQNFTETLVGRPIQAYKFDEATQEENLIYDGFIAVIPDSINRQSGTQFTLICNTTLAQLAQISSNANWDDSTQKYGNIFSTISGNTINYDELVTQIRIGSLSEDSEVIKIDGNATPMPEEVWAVILPNKDRLSVLKEILVPYSRVIYQAEDGNIIIQPLFINDKVSDIFNINCYNNYNGTWLGFNSRNAASQIPNRVDVLFGVSVPVNIFQNSELGSIADIYASAPKINKQTNLIESSNLAGILDYSQVYSTSTRLYNSGKFVMPVMETLSLDNSLFLNSILMNSVLSLYTSKDFMYSNIYVSGSNENNSIALLYAQIFLAQLNAQNYNATITYDYLKVSGETSPLGKIITIDNGTNIDYHEMIVTNTSLSFTRQGGCLYTIDTCPLLSITGVWSTI